MNKIMSFMLAGTLMLSLSACGGTSEKPAASDGETGATVTETTVPETSEVVFHETVLVDNETCIFKIVSVEEDNLWGYTLHAYLENKTDLELMFSLDQVSVNGFMCDPFWAASVMPGMKANEAISFSADDFARNGIASVTEITFTLNVYDSEDFTADYLIFESFTIYPQGEDAVIPYVRTPEEGELVLFDNDDCTMIVTGFDPDNTWGYTVNVYLENKTEVPLMFSADDVAVNGFMCDPFWAESVAPGKRSNTTISWMTSDFEDNGITEVTQISLPIRVYDETDWSRDDLVCETFVIEP